MFCLEAFVNWFIADRGLKSEQISKAVVLPKDVVRYIATKRSAVFLTKFAEHRWSTRELLKSKTPENFRRLITCFALQATHYLQGEGSCSIPPDPIDVVRRLERREKRAISDSYIQALAKRRVKLYMLKRRSRLKRSLPLTDHPTSPIDPQTIS